MRAISSAWKTGTVPEKELVDLFYVNHTFDPPVSGVIVSAMRVGDSISAANGAVLPLNYVHSWKEASLKLDIRANSSFLSSLR